MDGQATTQPADAYGGMRALEPIFYDGRVRCPYCLGAFSRPRNDKLWCSAACKKAAEIALHAVAAADLPLVGQRRARPSPERRAMTGYGTVGPLESVRADLRVRALALAEFHSRRQAEAALEWAETLPRVAEASGYPLWRLEAFDVDVAAVLRGVGWVR